MYQKIQGFCQDRGITLVVVTKTRPVEKIMEFYNQGHRIFGENRTQELAQKYEEMPRDIEWHMIGHLQSNKVKYIASFVSMIHSGASLSLLKEINKRARQNDRIIDVLLQIKIGQEEAKSGWVKDELFEMLKSGKHNAFEHIRIRGVMGMATFTDDKEQITKEFNTLKAAYSDLKTDHPHIHTISMGMSGDYQLAIDCGSTMIRVGSSIFGRRNYLN